MKSFERARERFCHLEVEPTERLPIVSFNDTKNQISLPLLEINNPKRRIRKQAKPPLILNHISPCPHVCRNHIAGGEESLTPTLNKSRLGVSSCPVPIHHHRNITSRLSLDVLDLEVDVGAALRQRSVEAGKTEEQLRDGVPPVTDNPAVELVAGIRRAVSTVPLQAGGVDEETVAACGRTAVAKVDAHWLPAGVGDLGGVHVHGPVVCQRIDMI